MREKSSFTKTTFTIDQRQNDEFRIVQKKGRERRQDNYRTIELTAAKRLAVNANLLSLPDQPTGTRKTEIP
jgi:hypothetical protein